jgi:CRISPR-associated Csx10 family RAMP protein
MGRVTIAADEVEGEQDRFEAFTARLNAFNDLLHKQAGEYGLRGLQDSYFFALSLNGPLIVCDDLLRYYGTLDAGALEKLLDTQIPGLWRIYQNASIRRVTGWQELWGLPRTNEYAIEMGSVFLFGCSAPLTQTALNALFQLEEQGTGKRRAEGFGYISVSDQFHQEIEMR